MTARPVPHAKAPYREPSAPQGVSLQEGSVFSTVGSPTPQEGECERNLTRHLTAPYLNTPLSHTLTSRA